MVTGHRASADTDLQGTEIRTQHQIYWTSLAGRHGKPHIMTTHNENKF